MDRRSDDIEQILRRTLREAGVPEAGAVLVAFSGGADSSALLTAACAVGCRVRALHCNFHLRGAESDRDECFCRELADTLGAELRVRHFDVPERMQATGESVEMAARELRYDWFAAEHAMAVEELQDGNAQSDVPLLTAHHEGDNVETMLLNLHRGSGMRGLAGIPSRRGYILRPFLEVPKATLVDYLAAKGVGFVTDSTNLVADVRRNAVRLEALPALEASLPGFAAGVSRSLHNLRNELRLLRRLVEERRRLYAAEGGGIDIRRLLSEEGADAAQLLYHMLDGALHQATVERVLDAPEVSGRIFEGADGARFLLDRGVLARIDEDALPQKPHIEAVLLDVADFAPERGRNDVLWLDADALAADARWELRQWRHGDRLAPFGMKGTRPVSSIIAEARVPLTAKSSVWVLECNGVPVWVVGLRASRHFAVGKTTRRVWRLRAM